ncbi:MAG TPA: hypothetical protein VM848_19730, partial [Acidimicrobiia bacterium]|nr:hypothetical protein [Acidimicrobiia bacterium]
SDTQLGDRRPGALPAPGPPSGISYVSILSWLHPLKIWSLQKTRGGSVDPRRSTPREVGLVRT